MFWRIKRLCWNIKVVIQWLPIIWNNFDFDWCYLIEVFQHKLKLMEKFYKSDNTVCVDAERHTKSIKICRILCDRLIADDYMDCLGLEFTKFDKTGQQNNLGICSDWLSYDDYMQKQDLELLCKLIRKNLFSWWD